MDLKDIKKLVALMNENAISEIEIEEEGRKIRIRRGAGGEILLPDARLLASREPVPLPLDGGRKDAPASPKDATVTINSPMVGTFYHAPQPGAAPFVRAGDTVGPDTIVCIIEAMKIMNEVKAEMRGEIVGLLVEDGEAVEYNQPLFVIKPSV